MTKWRKIRNSWALSWYIAYYEFLLRVAFLYSANYDKSFSRTVCTANSLDDARVWERARDGSVVIATALLFWQ
jgi:hypothetical protein